MAAMAPVKVVRRIRIITLALALLGVGLSGYSIYVAYRKNADKDYQAYCDIGDNISCSKIFTTKYGKGLGFLESLLGTDSPLVVSNGIYGIVFYSIVILLGELTSLIAAQIQKYFVILTNIMSVYLAYILLFVLRDMCVVCIATYVINLLLAACCFVRVRHLYFIKSKKKGSGKSANKSASNESSKNASETSNKNAKQSSKKAAKQNASNANQQNAVNAKQNAKQNAAKQNSTNAVQSSAQAKQNANAKQSAAKSKQNSANAKQSPANAKQSPANAKQSPANAKQNPASAKQKNSPNANKSQSSSNKNASSNKNSNKNSKKNK